MYFSSSVPVEISTKIIFKIFVFEYYSCFHNILPQCISLIFTIYDTIWSIFLFYFRKRQFMCILLISPVEISTKIILDFSVSPIFVVFIFNLECWFSWLTGKVGVIIRFYFIHFSRLDSISIILFWENTGSASENYEVFEISNHSCYSSM